MMAIFAQVVGHQTRATTTVARASKKRQKQMLMILPPLSVALAYIAGLKGLQSIPIESPCGAQRTVRPTRPCAELHAGSVPRRPTHCQGVSSQPLFPRRHEVSSASLRTVRAEPSPTTASLIKTVRAILDQVRLYPIEPWSKVQSMMVFARDHKLLNFPISRAVNSLL